MKEIVAKVTNSVSGCETVEFPVISIEKVGSEYTQFSIPEPNRSGVAMFELRRREYISNATAIGGRWWVTVKNENVEFSEKEI